uniref:Uncharacterized protein n=1 Tax=Cucumis melo TaxID=3656 RepID=A0A9I9CC62_CUCME
MPTEDFSYLLSKPISNAKFVFLKIYIVGERERFEY